MSKTKSLRITALAAIVSLLLAFASLAVFMTARADDTQQIDTSKITVTTENMGIASGAMVIDFGLNSQSADAGIAQTEQATVAAKVILTRNGTETSFSRFLLGKGKIGIDLNEGFTDGTKPAAIQEGDTLTLKSGLAVYNVTAGGMNNWFATDPVTLATLAEDVTLTYSEGGWHLPGQGFPSIAAADVTVTVVPQGSSFGGSAHAVVIDFGLNSTSDVSRYADGNRDDIPLQYSVWQDIDSHLTVKRNGEKIPWLRYVFGQGKIGYDYDYLLNSEDESLKGLVKGDELTLTKDLIVCEAIGDFFGYPTDKTPIGKLAEDVTFIYNGTSWATRKAATYITITNKSALQNIVAGNSADITVETDGNDVITYTSSDTTVATVNSSGKITALKEGTCTVTVSCGAQSDSVEVTVGAPFEPIITVSGGAGYSYGGNGNALVIDFGITDGFENRTGLVDKSTGGWGFGGVEGWWKNNFNAHIEYYRGATKIEHFRYIAGMGKVGMDVVQDMPDAQSGVQKGDYMTLKNGLEVWSIPASGGHISGYCIEYNKIFTLAEDVTLVYDGSAWRAPVDPTSITINNKQALSDLHVKQKVAVDASVNEEALLAGVLTYEITSGSQYATIEGNVISAVAEGEVTVRASYGSVHEDHTFTVLPQLAVTGVIVDVGNYQTATDGNGGQKGDCVVVKNGKAYLRAYKGEPLEPNITAGSNVRNVTYSLAYGEGIEGSTQANLKKTYLAETGANFTFVKNVDAGTVKASWGKYTFTATGAQAIPVSVTVPEGEKNAGETVTGELPVWVYDAPKAIAPIAAAQICSWGNHLDIPFGASIDGAEVTDVRFLSFSKRNILKYGLAENPVILHGGSSQGDAIFAIQEIGHISNKQYAVLFENASAKDFAKLLPAGSVLELTENFRFYEWVDGDFVAKYTLTEPVKYVWTGKGWADFTSDATDFTVADALTVPQYAKFALDITLTPPDAYLAVTYASDNMQIVEVLQDGTLYAKSAGKANITVTAVAGESKTVAVTVSEGSQRSIAIANDRTFRVQKDGTLDLSKIRVKVCYGTGSNGKAYYGEEIALTAEGVTAELKSGDFTKAGKGTATVSVTLTDHGTQVTGDISATVEVPEIFEIYPDNLTCADDKHIFKNTIAIYFNKTFVNQANVYLDDLTPEQKQSIIDHIEYSFVRGDSNVKLEVQGYLQQMLFVVPYTGDSASIEANQIGSYVNGDRITLKAGLEFYAWFGDRDSFNVPVGEGEYIKVGELKYDAVFTYNAGKWSWQVEPADGIVLQEKVTVGIGEQHRANVEIVPVYATNGEWYYTVADSSVATIDTKGLITGKKIGSTQVTAVLKDRLENTIKTVTFDIEVVDAVKSLQITASKKVTVKTGTDLDVAKLVSDFGIKGNVVMASGNIGKEVDLTKAKITGYKADENGKQTITFRLTVDGKSVTGTLDITVGKSSKKKCGGAVSAANAVFAGGGLLAVVILLCLRKRKQNA